MRRLLVLRHAKAAPAAPGQRDLDRPLAERGRRDAAAVGAALSPRGLRPDHVLASPALRVRETLEAFLPAAGCTLGVQFEGEVYSGGAEDLLRAVQGLPSECRCALLAGHNPAVEALVARLTGEPGPEMSTSTLACLEADLPWADLADGTARLAWLLRP